MTQLFKSLYLLLLTEECWCNSMNQFWFTLSQYSFVHGLSYISLIFNNAECRYSFGWQDGVVRDAPNSFIQHRKLICPACCQVSDVVFKIFVWRVSLICECLTLISSTYPARLAFCYYLNSGRWKCHSAKQGKGWIENLLQPFPVSFLFLFPRENT